MKILPKMTTKLKKTVPLKLLQRSKEKSYEYHLPQKNCETRI